jgi:hypothetical protein
MMAFLDILAGLSSLPYLGTDMWVWDSEQCSCIAVDAVKVAVADN